MNVLLENVIVVPLVRLLPETCFCSPTCRLHRVTYVTVEDTVSIGEQSTTDWLNVNTLRSFELQKLFASWYSVPSHNTWIFRDTAVVIIIIIIIINNNNIIRHQLVLDRPVSAPSNSLFKVSRSHLRPFGLQFSIILCLLDRASLW